LGKLEYLILDIKFFCMAHHGYHIYASANAASFFKSK